MLYILITGFMLLALCVFFYKGSVVETREVIKYKYNIWAPKQADVQDILQNIGAFVDYQIVTIDRNGCIKGWKDIKPHVYHNWEWRGPEGEIGDYLGHMGVLQITADVEDWCFGGPQIDDLANYNT